MTKRLSDYDAATMNESELRDLETILRSGARSEVNLAKSRLGVEDDIVERTEVAIAKGASKIDAAKLSREGLADLHKVLTGNDDDRIAGAENLGILLPTG